MSLDTLVASLQQKASGADALGKSIKFDFGGEQILIDGSGDSNVVSTEDKEADCTVGVAKGDFEDLVSGALNPMMAFMSGKLKIDGDMSVAMKLNGLFG